MSEERGRYDALSLEQRRLLDIIKEIDYGEIEKVVIRRGLPVFVQVAKQNIKLD